jgi:hypothetical protein
MIGWFWMVWASNFDPADLFLMGGRHQSDNMGLSEHLGNPAVYGHVMVMFPMKLQ